MLPPGTKHESHRRGDLHPSKKSWLRKDRGLRSSDTESSQRSPSPVRRQSDKEIPITHFTEDTLENPPVASRQPADHCCEQVDAHATAMECNDGDRLPRPVKSGTLPGSGKRKTDPEDGFVAPGETATVQRTLGRARKPRRMDFASSPALAAEPVEPASPEKNVSRQLPQQDPIEHEVEALNAILPSEVTINPARSNNNIAVALPYGSTVNSDNVSRDAGDSSEQPKKEQNQQKHIKLGDSNVGDQSDTAAAATNVVPSAQIVPQFAVQVNSNLSPSITPIQTAELTSSDRDIFHEAQPDVTLADDSIIGLSTQAAVAKVQENLRAGLISADSSRGVFSAGSPSQGSGERSRDGIKLFRALNTPSSNPLQECDDNRSYEHVDTQAMLGAITPFALATVRAKPVAQPPGDLPVKVSKPREKKRASFAPASQDLNSSARSIKSCLKVTKSKQNVDNESVGKGLQTEADPQEPLVSDDFNSGMRGNGDPSSKKQLSDLSHQGVQAKINPNGPPTSSTAPFSNSNMTHASQIQHEAQPMKDQVAMGKDDLNDFDLSSVIDDIGSFLQSWDPEKEMRNLGTARV